MSRDGGIERQPGRRGGSEIGLACLGVWARFPFQDGRGFLSLSLSLSLCVCVCVSIDHKLFFIYSAKDMSIHVLTFRLLNLLNEFYIQDLSCPSIN